MRANTESVNTETQKLVICVKGGVIASVDGIPAGVDLVIRDYDVEMCDDDELKKDEDGDEYIESTY